MKIAIRTLSVLILLAGAGRAALADDTDIYLDPHTASTEPPLVMFTMDYTSSFNSNQCNYDPEPGGLDADVEAEANICDTFVGGGSEDLTGAEVQECRDIVTTCQGAGVYSAAFAKELILAGAHADDTIELLEKVLAAMALTAENLAEVKIGLTMVHDTQNNCEGPAQTNCSNGAMIMQGFEHVDVGTNRQDFKDLLRSIPTEPDKFHKWQPKEMYFEIFRYLTGQDVYNGHNGWNDFENGSPGTNLDTDAYPGWDAGIEDGAGKYISPLVDAMGDPRDCTAVYVVNFTKGGSQQDDDSDDAIVASPASGGLLGRDFGGDDDEFTDILTFMHGDDTETGDTIDFGDGTWADVPDLAGSQRVTSYFVAETANATQHGWAAAGGTNEAISLGEDPDDIVAAIDDIFDDILALSTTFVAPSVPVNVFNRAQTVNELFLALFEADDEGFPLWNGNLKKIVIGTDGSGAPELQDANGDPAIGTDGRLVKTALTFWTDGTNLPAIENPLEEEPGKDGRGILRGGAGQLIPGVIAGSPGNENTDAGARQLFTENAAANGLMALDATAATALLLTNDLDPAGGLTAAEELDALEFARGLESDGSTVREWMLADPLHSRPRPINYGARTGFSTTNPDIRIIMGTNDGFMHLFQNTETNGDQSGVENWAFMPRSALKGLNRLDTNTPGSPKHPNSTDGSPIVLIKDFGTIGNIGDDGADQVLVFFGMRRGGNNMYALDVTDPDNPVFEWRIDGGTGDFSELTQTWSPPTLGKVRLETPLGSGTFTTYDVLVFGGGYNGDDDGSLSYAECDAIAVGLDTGVSAPASPYDDLDAVDETDRVECFDSLGKDKANRITRHNKVVDPDVARQVGADDPHGNAIYVVDAQTGDLLWKVEKNATAGYDNAKTFRITDLDDSIPSEITAVDTTGNSLLDRIYAADTGGRVWRADIASTDLNDWTVMKFFDAGRHFVNDVANDRRFFNRVDISQTRDTIPFDAVLIGSGDREDPLSTDRVNWFYMIKDRNIVSGSPPTKTLVPEDTDGGGTEEGLADLSTNCLQDPSKTLATCFIDADKFANGWRIELEHSGEKNLAAALTIGGEVFFTTFAPTASASACGLSEGSGRFYALSLQDATAIQNFDTTNDGSGTTYERFDDLESGGIPVEVVPLGGGKILVQGQEVGQNIEDVEYASGFRTYWHELPEL